MAVGVEFTPVWPDEELRDTISERRCLSKQADGGGSPTCAATRTPRTLKLISRSELNVHRLGLQLRGELNLVIPSVCGWEASVHMKEGYPPKSWL